MITSIDALQIKTEYCHEEDFRVVSLKFRSIILRLNEESKNETKNAKILTMEFRESCGDVFNRSDEKTSTKTIANNYNYNFLQIKPTLIEGQISMKRKVQAHSLLDNRYFCFESIFHKQLKVCVPFANISNTHRFLDFLGFCNLMSPGTSSLANRCFSYP